MVSAIALDPKFYPICRSARRYDRQFVRWDHLSWLASEMHLKGSYEVQGISMALFCIALNQKPIGTLPIDEGMIARLLRIDDGVWHHLQRSMMPPLHGWKPCVACDGEPRLYHRAVVEQMLEHHHPRPGSGGAEAGLRGECRCLAPSGSFPGCHGIRVCEAQDFKPPKP